MYDLDHDGTEEIIINSYNYRDISVFKYDAENNTGVAVTLQMNTDPVLAFGIFETFLPLLFQQIPTLPLQGVQSGKSLWREFVFITSLFINTSLVKVD